MADLTLLVASLVLVPVLVACSAFFSISESAISSLSDEWVQDRAGDGPPDGAELASLPHRLLVTYLLSELCLMADSSD